jgi:hypothetical protein
VSDDIPQRPLDAAALIAARNGHTEATTANDPDDPATHADDDGGVAMPILVRGAELAGREFPPIAWLVDNILQRGALAVIAGRPKSGKSWLALQAAQAIDTGAPFLGKTTTRAKVLYVAAEDGARRVHQRMRLRGWQPQQTDFVFALLPLDQGGIDQLRELIAREKYDLVVLDTLRRLTSAKIDENASGDIAEVLYPLAELAKETGATFLVVHHTGKLASEDPFNSIRGSSAIRGAYDQGIVLLREQRENGAEAEALLCFEAKDFDTDNVTISFSASHGWSYAGDAGQRDRTRSNKQIADVLEALWRETGEDTFDTERIAKALSIAKQSAHAKLRDAAAATPPVVRCIQAKPAPGTKGGRPADRWQLIDTKGA